MEDEAGGIYDCTQKPQTFLTTQTSTGKIVSQYSVMSTYRQQLRTLSLFGCLEMLFVM